MSTPKYTTKRTMGRYGVYADGKLVCSIRDCGTADKVAYLLGVVYAEAYDAGREAGDEAGYERGYDDGVERDREPW